MLSHRRLSGLLDKQTIGETRLHTAKMRHSDLMDRGANSKKAKGSPLVNYRVIEPGGLQVGVPLAACQVPTKFMPTYSWVCITGLFV